MRSFAAVLALLLVLSGCHHADTAPAAPAPTISSSPKTTPSETPTQTPAPSEPTASNTPTPASTPPPPPALSVPHNLKNAAYEYYGLGNSKPVDYEISQSDGSGIRTGSQTTTLKEVKDGKAIFAQTRTGGLDIMNNDEVSLDAIGVHVESSPVLQVKPGNLEFPADVTPGKTWTSQDESANSNGSFDISSVYTVKGVVPLHTKRGTLQALLITSKSQGTRGSQKLTMQSETYYVKGIGLAKANIKMTTAGAKPVTIIQELSD